jgi:hypothetical protein
MKARGFNVDMDVIEDREICRVFADVVITSPEKPERGKVHIWEVPPATGRPPVRAGPGRCHAI